MDSGYRTPLIDFFRRGEIARDVKLLAAQGALASSTHEQVALLLLLIDDPDGEIGATARATVDSLPRAAVARFIGRADVPEEMRGFFEARGIAALRDEPAGDEALLPDDDDAEEGGPAAGEDADAPKLLAGLPVKKKMKLAFKGTREQRAQLIRDPNKIVAAAVLSSPKLTDAEVEAFAKMANVSEEVLRVIGGNRTWLKNYGVVLGLVKNPKTPPAISMQLLPRVNERDLKMISVDRNVPEALKLAARKFVVKALK